VPAIAILLPLSARTTEKNLVFLTSHALAFESTGSEKDA